jgi:predicted small metal-binding protein
MRAKDRPCGHELQAADDEEPIERCNEHIADHHPEMQRTDEQIRQRVAADAYDVEVVA